MGKEDIKGENIEKCGFQVKEGLSFQIIRPGGWHFSFVLTLEQIAQKYRDWSHNEYNNHLTTSLDYIKQRIAQKKRVHDIGNKDIDNNEQIVYETIDEEFPMEIFKN